MIVSYGCMKVLTSQGDTFTFGRDLQRVAVIAQAGVPYEGQLIFSFQPETNLLKLRVRTKRASHYTTKGLILKVVSAWFHKGNLVDSYKRREYYRVPGTVS